MGAEFFKITIDAETKEDVNWAYEKTMNILLDEKADDEANYLLDLLITNEVDVGKNERYKSALEAYKNGNEDEAVEILKKHLISSQSESLYMYTGTFLSSDYGINFLNHEFNSEEEATTFIEEHHQKWDMPMAAQIKDSNKWVIAGWCSS